VKYRIALGCMRLSTECDEARARVTIQAALDAGVVWFDTAHAYCHDDDDRGHNERLLSRALGDREAIIATKCGMKRPGGKWVVDGRARSIAEDCDASLAALDGRSIDLMFLHAIDPAVPLSTSVKALVSLMERGKVKSIGVSNVNRAQLDEAIAIVDAAGTKLAAVQVSLSWLDDKALKGGVVARCVERGIVVMAHRPLGGTRVATIRRDRDLREVARHIAARSAGATNVTPENVALAALVDLDTIPIVGATTPEHARDLATIVALDDADREILAKKLSRRYVTGSPAPANLVDDGEVVLLMGIQGAGKTEALSSWLARGYERINRDERGGTMRELHRHLERTLAGGAKRIVLDNTYVTRSVRRDALEAAWKHRLPVRGVWFDTALADAQVNVVVRMLKHHGRLLTPDELTAIGGPTALPPNAQHRLLRTLEKPHLDEGFSALDVVTFARRSWPGSRGALFVSLDALTALPALDSAHAMDAAHVIDAAHAIDAAPPLENLALTDGAAEPPDVPSLALASAPVLVYAWQPRVDDDVALSSAKCAFPNATSVAFAACKHGAGPPICWCRPPLPGLILAFALANDVDPARSVVVARGPPHRAMAAAIGARFVEV
jgi:aryl-alcohol dehydrogenase-like predicted oxidoreductase